VVAEVVVVVPALVVVVVAVFVEVAAVVVVVAVEPAFTMASTVAVLGAVGVTPVGSKAMVTRMYSPNLIAAGFVVILGFVWEIVDQ
jgi:hypothetical protein